MSLHNSQELDNDLRGRSNQNLSLASLLGVGNSLKSISKNGSASHVELFLYMLVRIMLREINHLKRNM